MVARPKTIPADGTVADLRQLFANPHVATALLVDGELFAGAIDREQLPHDAPAERPAREVARHDVDVIDPDTSMATALARMDAGGQRRLVVLDPDGRTLRGLLCLTPDRTGFCQGTPEPTATG